MKEVANTGEELAETSRDQSEVLAATFHLDAARRARMSSGFYRERRTGLYRCPLGLDGGPA